MQIDPIQYGATQAVDNCVKVQENDRVVIVTDLETKHLGEAILEACRKRTVEIQFFIMEDFGERASAGSQPLQFPEAIADALNQATASFYIAQGQKGELKSFRMPMARVVNEKKIRHAHMIGFSEEMMAQGMSVDYKAVQTMTKKVYDIVKNAKSIKVTTPAGTNLLAEFSSELKWIISDGNITPEKWSNLPDGETFTSPKNINGKIVVDGVLGDSFSKDYGLLDKFPLSFELKDGWVVQGSITCENKKLETEFNDYVFNTDENSARLGEFAIGTNIGLEGLIGNLLQDEKFPGVHVAVGNPYPEKTGANWKSDAHCDGVLQNCTIEVDGNFIMREGKFLI